MIQRIVRKALWGLFFFAFFENFFVPILTSGGLAAVSSSGFAALCSAFGRYDVVHIHAEGPAFFAWLPKLLGKRVVVTIHGIDWQREKWQSGLGSKFMSHLDFHSCFPSSPCFSIFMLMSQYMQAKAGRMP